MPDTNNYQNMSKYAVYRKIRADRAYRTLGKMNIYRVAVGILLLILVLFLSGAVSQYFAVRGRFAAADALMLSPRWVEKYKPELKEYVQAGVMYENGEYEQAYDAFAAIEGLDIALSMRDAAAVKLSAVAIEAGDFDGAYDMLLPVDASALPRDSAKEYLEICGRLLERYTTASQTERCRTLQELIDIAS